MSYIHSYSDQVIKVDLPDFHKNEKSFTEFTPEEKRSFYKENGIQPTRPWNEKPFSVDSSPGVIDEYIPPEGDGKLSALNTAVSNFLFSLKISC